MEGTKILHIARRLTQIGFLLLIFLMPVFDILRYDTATKDLYLFGQVWSLGLKSGFYNDPSLNGATHVAIHFFLKAILPWVIVLSIFPLLGVLFGRFFCGWLCPEGALFELADFLSLKLLGRRSLYKSKPYVLPPKVGDTVTPKSLRHCYPKKSKTFWGPLFGDHFGGTPYDPDVKRGNKFLYGTLAALFLLTVPPLTGIALTGYFIAPKTIWHQITTGNFTFGVKAGIIGVSIYMFVTSILVRHTFCKYVCAAGLMQMLFGWVSPISLRIRFDRKNLSACTDCKGCEMVCFMDVKPRYPRKDINCVNCGECIIACKKELGDKCLFSYSFGSDKVEKSKQIHQERPIVEHAQRL